MVDRASYVEELSVEQQYFDDVLEEREKSRAQLMQAPANGAGNKAAVSALNQAVKRIVGNFPAPDSEVAFGRFDTDERTLYIGRQGLFSDERDVLVVNWKLPAAAPFYEAHAGDPKGVVRVRKFDNNRNTIRSFEDTLLQLLAERVAELTDHQKRGVDDALLRDLEAARDGEMRDIVQTIHASQYDLIRRPLEQLLVVQGGPGTGKTAVALHRASWLLFNHQQELTPEDILVIAPNKTFTRYIRKVLPGLGDEGVVQTDLRALGPVTGHARPEEKDVARLKGEERMFGLIRSALRQRVRFPDTDRLTIGQRPGSPAIPRADVEAEMDISRKLGTYSGGRRAMRDWLARAARQRVANNVTIEPAAVDAALERVWPQLTPAQFLQELLGSRPRITAAAGDDFTAGDIDRLYRQAAGRLGDETWADSDVALLDAAEVLISGRAAKYKHIVVDEAQDLSPMQLRSIRRRSVTGSYTIVGDLAQSTGAWARNSWDEIIAGLKRDHPSDLVELEYGYRVPSQVMELADLLLPSIAPDLKPATVIRRGPQDPEFVSVDVRDVADATVRQAREYASQGLFIGIICAEALHDSVVKELSDRKVSFNDASTGLLGNINLMTAEQSKGLEFDAVVLVEPAAIAETDDSGLRHLYIAMTRTTRHLAIVHGRTFELLGLDQGAPDGVDLTRIEEVTAPSTEGVRAPGTAEETLTEAPTAAIPKVTKEPASLRDRMIQANAKILAEEIRGNLDRDSFERLVQALADELGVMQRGWNRDQLF